MFQDVPSIVFRALGGVFAVLVVATIVVEWLGRGRPPGAAPGELQLRVRSWWMMSIVFSLAMVVSRAVSIVFFAFLSFLALKEYFSLIPTRRADRRALFWAYLAIPIQYWWVAKSWYGMFIIFIPVYVFLLLPLRLVLIGQTEGFLRSVGTIHWGAMLMVFSLSHVAYLLALPAEGNPAAGGAGLVLFLVILTEANDVAQYIWGKSFGRHKVLPTVSPNKTYEGLIGGVATTIVMSMLLAPWLTPLIPREALLAGVIIGLGGFAGDVTISALKRDLKIKDTGALLPGHGGILDRVDSLTYTAPLFFHFIFYLRQWQ